MRIPIITGYDSPIQSDRDSQASSLEDYEDSAPVLRQTSSNMSIATRLQSARHIQSAHTRRVSLSRGLTHLRTPASTFMAELTEESLSFGEKEISQANAKSKKQMATFKWTKPAQEVKARARTLLPEKRK